MQEINLIFPNQLFESSTLIENNLEVYLIEENLFFNQYKFHKQKIYFHRSSMLKYFDFLNAKNIKANYISSYEPRSDIRTFIEQLNKDIRTINVINPDDNWLEKRLSKSTKSKNIELKFHENKSFITPKSELAPFFRSDKKKLFQTSFYKSQR